MEYQVIISLLTLIALEIVLGIDNVVFISITASKLPETQQKKARQLGLVLAGILRMGLLLLISFILKLEKDLFTIFEQGFSGKDLVLIAGGLFLLYKSTSEIYHKMEVVKGSETKATTTTTFGRVIVQILMMDLVFSIDSVITAIGIVKEIWVMYIAIIVTVGIMMFAAEPVNNFVKKHPAFKMLALSFLLLIGFSLISEGFGIEIPKGYIYFSMAFSLLVDIFQMNVNKSKSQQPSEPHV